MHENKNILINIIIDFMKDLIMIIQNLLIIKNNKNKLFETINKIGSINENIDNNYEIKLE